MSVVTVKISLVGARGLSRRVMHRLRACDTKINTGNVGPSALVGYKNEYRLIHDRKKGFAWVEVYYAHGMCGWHKSLREAVARAVLAGMVVHLDEVWRPARAPGTWPIRERDCLACWGVVPDFRTDPTAKISAGLGSPAVGADEQGEKQHGSGLAVAPVTVPWEGAV